MIPYRLAAIDLDDTLLGPDHRISPRNAAAVRALAKKGVVCVLASGRMHQATTRFAAELGLHAPIISYNGSMVRGADDPQPWLHLRVPADAAAEIIQYCAENILHLNYYLNDRLLVASRGRWAMFYVRQTGSPMEEAGDLLPFRGTEPTKMILIDEPATIELLRARFQERFGNSLYITTTNPEYLEFMNPAASKGAALTLVADRLKIAREETIAFGDGHNDIPMLKWAGFAVAMAGSKPAALSEADYVASGYEEDGLGRAIEHLFGI